MNESVRSALNEQVRRELQAAYFYLAVSNWFEREGLDGFSSWMGMQASEEYGHAMRIVDHLQDREAAVEYGALEAPTAHFGSAEDAVRAALEHEQRVTGHIHDLYELAVEEGDHPAAVMLEWFVEEQVEEEHTFHALIEKLELAGDSGPGLLILDEAMAERSEE